MELNKSMQISMGTGFMNIGESQLFDWIANRLAKINGCKTEDIKADYDFIINLISDYMFSVLGGSIVNINEMNAIFNIACKELNVNINQLSSFNIDSSVNSLK